MILIIVIGRQEIEQLVNPFGSIFLLISNTRPGKIPGHVPLVPVLFQENDFAIWP